MVYTNEMIAYSSKFYFVFKFVMPEHFTTNSVQPWVDDFCVFYSLSVDFHLCNTWREAHNKLVGVIVGYRKEDVNSWQQSIRGRSLLVRITRKSETLPTGENLA